MQTATELRTAIRNSGLRATAARVAVYNCLVEAGGPLTHGEVCDQLAGSGFDRATVYRNLADLTEAQLVKRTDLGDHLWRFELVRENASTHEAEDPHAHFVCTECGTVECLPEEAVTVQSVKGAPQSLKKRKVEIQVRGTCNDCD